MQKRAEFHFQPDKGWINDPNGLIYYKGQYHAFFQYNPDELRNNRIRWGHAVSDDLLHWKQLPSAIFPDEEYDAGGCWSGSAIEKDGKLYLFYTAVPRQWGQAQAVAVSSDGINFKKYAGNPVIPGAPIPANDFRDPKVGRLGDGYYMVVGSGCDGEGKILLYTSVDLLDWKYEGVLYEGKGLASVYECPDLFPLGDKYVLMFSKMCQTVKSAHFVIGTFDGKRFVPESESEPENGPHFFAPQTFEDGQGRRILIAWMNDWTRKPAPDDTFAGSFTIPREVKITDGKIFLYPVAEAEKLLSSDCGRVRIKGNVITVEGKAPVTVPTEIRKAEFLEDGDLLEIFINDGEYSLSSVL